MCEGYILKKNFSVKYYYITCIAYNSVMYVFIYCIYILQSMEMGYNIQLFNETKKQKNIGIQSVSAHSKMCVLGIGNEKVVSVHP